ncbi:MAG: ribosome maturation factor RimM [Brevinematia bacterium]
MNPLCIGKIIKPYGLKGFLKVIFYIDDKKELGAFKSFFIKDKNEATGYRKVKFVSISGEYKFFNVKIEGCNDRTQADTLRGLEIFVDESELPELNKGLFYQKDLIGIDVLYNGSVFGKVANIIEVANRLILIVMMKNGKELAVPFSNQYVSDISLKEKRLIAVKLEDLL